MPKQIIDYSKTIMYKIRHKEDIEDKEVYIGHTTNWIQRKKQHKVDCNCITSEKYNEKKYQMIRSKGGWEEWEMLPIELYPCSNKIEAVIREEYWRKDFNAKLNTLKAHTTEEERKESLKNYMEKYNPVYYDNNKEKMNKQNKEWYEANRDDILVKNKIRYEENKEEILTQQKKYYEENKEEISVKNKTYREENKDKIAQYDRERYTGARKEKYLEKVVCECGCISGRSSLPRHYKSKKHLDLMEQLNKNVCLLVE